MTIINKAISRKILAEMAQNFYGEMIKGVVDIDRQIMALDAELHSDLEKLLLENGSNQESLWGINLYPDVEGMTSLNSTHLSTSALEEITSAEMWKMRRYVVKSVQ